MEQNARTRRTPSTLPQALHENLNTYALAASAAGVALLAGAPPAEAKVVFTPAHIAIGTHQVLHLDLNHDGIADFAISNHQFCTTDICGRTLRALPLVRGNQVAGMKGLVNTLYASAFQPGSVIGPALQFSGKIMAASGTEYGSVGRWRNVTNRFLGLKFSIAGQTHFGWARFTVTSGTGKIQALLTGYAYETVANKLIVAGATHGSEEVSNNEMGPLSGDSSFDEADYPADAVAQHTLGMLAAGASALPVWRRKESVATPTPVA
jgi:hypothetical protein